MISIKCVIYTRRIPLIKYEIEEEYHALYYHWFEKDFILLLRSYLETALSVSPKKE
jgi:hypothetical protein